MGEVVEVGSANKKLKVGDRIVVPFTISCGECFFCKRGYYSGCERSRAKCWIQGSADPRRFELWGVCEDHNLSSLELIVLQPRRIHVSEEQDEHGSLPRFGPPCGVKPYSCFVVDWPHEEVEDELV
jgi:hypothetical protein